MSLDDRAGLVAPFLDWSVALVGPNRIPCAISYTSSEDDVLAGFSPSIACAGFLVDLKTADALREDGQKVRIVTGDRVSRVTDEAGQESGPYIVRAVRRTRSGNLDLVLEEE